jgi:hypothetical protein
MSDQPRRIGAGFMFNSSSVIFKHIKLQIFSPLSHKAQKFDLGNLDSIRNTLTMCKASKTSSAKGKKKPKGQASKTVKIRKSLAIDAKLQRVFDLIEEAKREVGDTNVRESFSSLHGEANRALDVICNDFEKIQRLSDDLTRKAILGDSEAASGLLVMGLLACKALRDVQEKQKDIIQRIAEENLGWPVVWTTSQQLNSRIRPNLESLGLGTRCDVPAALHLVLNRDEIPPSKALAWLLQLITNSLREHGLLEGIVQQAEDLLAEGICDEHVVLKFRSIASWRRSEDELALYLGTLSEDFGTKKEFDESSFRKFSELASELPDATSGDWKSWWVVAKEIFEYLTDGKPEQNSELKKIGIYRKGHTGDSPGSHASQIRDGIRTKLKKAFENQFREAVDIPTK